MRTSVKVYGVGEMTMTAVAKLAKSASTAKEAGAYTRPLLSST